MDCLFCKIAQGDIPAAIVHSDESIVAFEDIRPQAPTHLLIIPRQHIATINEVNDSNADVLARMVIMAKTLANTRQIHEKGYRLVFNVNSGGGQEIYHIHLHLLGGRQMSWPPG